MLSDQIHLFLFNFCNHGTKCLFFCSFNVYTFSILSTFPTRFSFVVIYGLICSYLITGNGLRGNLISGDLQQIDKKLVHHFLWRLGLLSNDLTLLFDILYLLHLFIKNVSSNLFQKNIKYHKLADINLSSNLKMMPNRKWPKF